MSEPKPRVRDRRDWPDGTIVAFDNGAPIIRLNGMWQLNNHPVHHEIPGAVVLRVGDAS